MNRLTIQTIFMGLVAVSLVACTQKSERQIEEQARSAQAAEYNVQLGLAYLNKDNIERAKKKLLTALQQAPRSTEAHSAMAFYLERTDEVTQADQYYRKALQLAPGQGAPANNYGAFLCRQGNFKQAEHYFLMAAADQRYVKTAQVFENAGLCALEDKQMEKAKYYFEKVAKKDPKRSFAFWELAKLAFELKDFQTVDSHLVRYHELAGPQAASYWLAYRSAKQQQRLKEAEKYAQLLVEKFPDSSEYEQYKQGLSS